MADEKAPQGRRRDSSILREQRRQSSWGSRWRRLPPWAWRLGVVAAVLYLLLANLALSTRWGRRLILPASERWTVAWSRAWSVLPGLVHFRDLEAAGRAPRLQWSLEVERGRAWIDPAGLFRRRVTLRWARGHGVTCSFDRSPSAVGAGGAATARAAPARERRLWRLDLTGARITSIGDCRLDRARVRGDGEIEADLSFELPRGSMRLALRELRLVDTSFFDEERRLAEVRRLVGSLETRFFDPRGRPLQELLEGWSGSLQLDATTANLGFLRTYLSRAPWLEIASEPGRLRLDLSFSEGRWLSGSRIDFASDDLRVRYLEYEARGEAELVGRVDEETPVLRAAFRRFEVRQQDRSPPHVSGERLVVEMTAADAKIAPPPHQRVTLDLPPSEVGDLTAYNVFLPAGAGVEIVGGRGEVAAHFELSTRDASGSGEVRLSSSDLEASYGDLFLSGGLELRVLLSQPDLELRRFSFDGSSLRIAETTLRSDGRVVSEDWHGVLRFGPSRLSLVPPLIGTAELELEMTDARPFLAFFAERRPRLEAVARLLRVRDIVGSTDLVLDGRSIFFDRLELESHLLLAEARLCLQPENRHGALYAKSLGIGLAARFEDRDRRWTLIRPRRWYRERAEAIRCEGAALTVPPTSAVP